MTRLEFKSLKFDFYVSFYKRTTSDLVALLMLNSLPGASRAALTRVLPVRSGSNIVPPCPPQSDTNETPHTDLSSGSN